MAQPPRPRTLPPPPLRGHTTSFLVVVAHSIEVADYNLVAEPAVLKTHPGCPPPLRCQRTHLLPEKPRLAAISARQGPGPRGSFSALPPGPIRHRNGLFTRQPFRRRPVPGTTRQHANEPPTALPVARPDDPRLPPQSVRLLLGPHSQSAAFETPGRPRPGTGNHPGPRRPSQVS
jgi:hypothetical protein